jgi:hypothetical protein
MKAHVASVSMRPFSIPGWKVKSKLPRRKPGELKRGLDAPLLAARQLHREELVQEPVRGEVLLDRVGKHLGQRLDDVRKSKLRKHGAGSVHIDTTLRRSSGCAHRATSASAA